MSFRAAGKDSRGCRYYLAGKGGGFVGAYAVGWWTITSESGDLSATCMWPVQKGSEFKVRVGQFMFSSYVVPNATRFNIGAFDWTDWFSAGGINMGYGGGMVGTVTEITEQEGPLGPASTRPSNE